MVTIRLAALLAVNFQSILDAFENYPACAQCSSQSALGLGCAWPGVKGALTPVVLLLDGLFQDRERRPATRDDAGRPGPEYGLAVDPLYLLGKLLAQQRVVVRLFTKLDRSRLGGRAMSKWT